MGGDYEDKVEVPAPKTKARPAPGQEMAEDEVIVSGIRFHQNKGHVHFHDDKAGLKCYVPVAQWWTAWQKLRSPQVATDPPLFTYQDLENETLLRVQAEIVGDAVRVQMGITQQAGPQTFDRTWHALDAFTNRTKG